MHKSSSDMFEKLEKLPHETRLPTSLINQWHQLVKGGYDESFITEWLTICKSQTELHQLTAFLSDLQISGVKQDALYKSIDASAFHSRQWAEATIALLNSDQFQHKPIQSSVHAFGYLCCCAESSQQGLLALKFADLVMEMLDQFGFEGAE